MLLHIDSTAIWPTLILTSVFSLVFLAYLASKVGHRPSDYPPGPPTLPILGNLHQIPATNTHVQFKKWAEEYGPIYSLVLGTRTVIVLSSDETVKDLLDKKGQIYSSRPDSYITEFITGGLSFAFMKYGSKWKLCHKIFESSINSRVAGNYLPYQELETKKLLFDLSEEPSKFAEHIRRFTMSLTTQMVLGFRTVSNIDPKLLQLYHDFDALSKILAQAVSVLVDLYPPLQGLPDFMLPVRGKARKVRKDLSMLFAGYWENFKMKVAQKTTHPCIAHKVLEAQKDAKISDDLASYICGFLLTAGADPTATQMIVFIQAMLLYPQVQRTAQVEIDHVCGDRMPTADDKLPYMRAVIKEVCRWMPTAILGIPHALMEEDQYMGYRIPKNAVIITNVWAIHTDPSRHPNPREFNPARYLSSTKSMHESALSSNPSDRDQFLFGAGRRFCPGIDIAENSLFLSFARVLWAFDINKAVNSSGKHITPNPDHVVGGLAASPAPFEADLQPRSEKSRLAVHKAWKLARKTLDEEEQWGSDKLFVGELTNRSVNKVYTTP